MKYPENIIELSQLPIDFMGMIFYEKSARYVDELTLSDLDILPNQIKRVGVFVNAEADFILNKVNQYGLNIVQLHGHESPEFCRNLSKTIPIIKAFSIENTSDIQNTKEYEGLCEYFLFDTKTPQYGGSGQKFDWNILNEYKGATPFLLSGGISVDDADSIRSIDHPLFKGIDLNSKFEIKPGEKNIKQLEQFIKEIQYEQD